MSLWLWIGLPLLFLLGLFLNAIKDMKQLEKQLPKYKDKIREVRNKRKKLQNNAQLSHTKGVNLHIMCLFCSPP